MLTKRWIFFRMLLPLVLASSTRLLDVWFRHNVQLELVPVVLPFLAAVINLYTSQFERPRIAPRGPQEEFRRRVAAWHALDGLGCLILMIFEAMSAIMVSNNQIGLIGLLVTIPVLFGPYVLVALWARSNLLRSYEILAADIVNGQNPSPVDGA
jgi:hypothetical protein